MKRFSMLLSESSDAGCDERAFVRAQIAASPDRNFGATLIFEPAPLSA